MRQTAMGEGKGPRLGYLSRTMLSSLYRTLLAPTNCEGQPGPDTTLQKFVGVFNSSPVCRATLKNELRHIIIKGAFKAWKPSASDTPTSVVPRDLFYQDITAPVLHELSQQFFSSFETVTPVPPSLNELYRQYDTCTILWYNVVADT
ncbi:hypothetical protein PV04_01149 [Phialophora macrospora]|uniref:Uncharacterized protein n=1 Tax=Phialophora macrospora TaxID=1851006 RepID=A0A0D2FX22_9EURO|nr:hypothetical protein PV04_01149 [Phialophora macrospora]